MKKTIILDLGSGSAHNNDIGLLEDTIDSIRTLQDKTKKIMFHAKVQLWNSKNRLIDKRLVPTRKAVFAEAWAYAMKSDIPFTTSVFDEDGRDFVLNHFEVPYLKLACRKEVYPLITKNVDWIVSVPDCRTGVSLKARHKNVKILYCVSRYPATNLDYMRLFKDIEDWDILDSEIEGLSDHTTAWDVYHYSNPVIYECHYALNKNKQDPFGNKFVRTFKDMEKIL